MKIDGSLAKMGGLLMQSSFVRTVIIGGEAYDYATIANIGMDWMTSNLRLDLTAKTGDSGSASAWYGGTGKRVSLTPVSGYADLGKLYCSTQAMQDELSQYLHDGWHMPTYSDLKQLMDLAGGDWRKLASREWWTSGGGEDTYGLSLTPGGDCYGLSCAGYGTKCNLWCDSGYYLSINMKHSPIMYIDSGTRSAYMGIRLCRPSRP